ncbi:Uncharacterised protein [Haemophilus influenzae]|nr:hypothetical protein BVZ93_00878 [Haemophilus influenzae]PRJ96553.1 hypothetical protein BV172_01451 [Haemophilus influenzae]PRK57143.1 hypothetical protein BV171_01082 [Haemophilus influenzae]PRM22281.1 hypothetical protein BVZ95_01471 [Haemophilus influenzae]PRM28291.1 hypothetical protein BVZ91_00968 [Haemophilus influenzae]
MVVKIRTDKSDVSVVIDSNIAFDVCYGFLGAKGDVTSFKGYVFLGYNAFTNLSIGAFNLQERYVTSGGI